MPERYGGQHPGLARHSAATLRTTRFNGHLHDGGASWRLTRPGPDPANGGPAGKAEGADLAGAHAGITIFDPVTVCDRATYESPIQPCAGIHYVLVNGQAVVKDQELVRRHSRGKPVRGCGRAEKRSALDRAA